MPQDKVISKKVQSETENDPFLNQGTTKEQIINRIKDIEKRLQALEDV
jgi:hypothetical protein